VSRLVFQSVVDLLLAVLSWYSNTEGVFQAALNVNASAVEMGRTAKSLNRCQRLSDGAVGSECATALVRTTPRIRRGTRERLTIDDADEMRFQRSTSIDVHHHADKRVDSDIVHAALQMQF